MPISELSVSGYRSIRSVRLRMKPVNILVGPNGCGKTNLYRSMVLLAAAAGGQLARELVGEGGMPSVLWAGARLKGPVRLALGVVAGALEYEIQCGLPMPANTMSALDPQVKMETLFFTEGRKRVALLERGLGAAWARDVEGRRVSFPLAFAESESVLSQ